MNALRDRAIERKARDLHEDARQLEQLSRHQPRVSRLAGEARRSLAAAELQVDCALTSREEDELSHRASCGDEDALAELTRRAA